MSSLKIQDGFYDAKPSQWGLTTSQHKNLPQFAIEFAIQLPAEATEDGVAKVVHLTKFCGMEGEQLEWLADTLAACGADSDNLKTVQLRAESVRVSVKSDSYGPKVKGVFPQGGGGSGALVKKNAMDASSAAAVAAAVQSKLAALRAKREATAGTPAPQPKVAVGQDFGREPGDDSIPF